MFRDAKKMGIPRINPSIQNQIGTGIGNGQASTSQGIQLLGWVLMADGKRTAFLRGLDDR